MCTCLTLWHFNSWHVRYGKWAAPTMDAAQLIANYLTVLINQSETTHCAVMADVAQLVSSLCRNQVQIVRIIGRLRDPIVARLRRLLSSYACYSIMRTSLFRVRCNSTDTRVESVRARDRCEKAVFVVVGVARLSPSLSFSRRRNCSLASWKIYFTPCCE